MRNAMLMSVACLCAMSARAGVVLKMSNEGEGPAKASVDEVYYAQGGMMRIDSLDSSGSITRIDLVRDGVIWQIDPRQRTYTRIDHSNVKSFFGVQNEQLQAMMANMPPERRAMMQAQIAKMQQTDFTYSDTGRSDHAGQYACRVWTEDHGSSRFAEYCVVPTSSLPGGAELETSMKTALDTVSSLTSGVPVLEKTAEHFTRLKKMNGFPVRTRSLSPSGETRNEHLLTAVESHALPADKFAIPRDFTEKPLGGGRSD